MITDLDGKYSIQVPENGAVLKFSYIGFKTKSFNVVKGKNVLNVTLEEDAVMLEQTVVTAMDLRRDEKSLSTALPENGCGKHDRKPGCRIRKHAGR